jgi:hypothetical protein
VAGSKPNRSNAPISNDLSTPETVTVIDPHHALFNQTFPLLRTKNKQEKITRCLISLPDGGERWLPVEVTNFSEVQPAVFPVLLDLPSLENLVKIYLGLQVQFDQEGSDGSERQTDRNGKDSQTAAGVGDARSGTAGDSPANDHPDLPGDPGEQAGGGHE